MVATENWMPPKLKNEFSAIPVTMPGSANGRMSMRLMASRPKKVSRCMANAAKEPNTSAIAVAARPA